MQRSVHVQLFSSDYILRYTRKKFPLSLRLLQELLSSQCDGEMKHLFSTTENRRPLNQRSLLLRTIDTARGYRYIQIDEHFLLICASLLFVWSLLTRHTFSPPAVGITQASIDVFYGKFNITVKSVN